MAERDALAAELEIAEQRVAALVQPEPDASAPSLAGLTLLYVGGRQHHIPALRATLEAAEGRCARPESPRC